MERILYCRSSRRAVEACALGFGAMLLLTHGALLAALACLFLAAERLMVLIPGASFLKLDPQGFTTCHWFREARYQWTDIDQFKIITTRYMGIIPMWRFVGFTYAQSSGKRSLGIRIAGAINRYDIRLPNNYGLNAKDLARLLDQWKQGVLTNKLEVPQEGHPQGVAI